MAGWLRRHGALVLIPVATLTVVGALVLLSLQGAPAEIVLTEREVVPAQGTIYLSGEVANPGFYPWQKGDSIEDILSASGLLKTADVKVITVRVPKAGEQDRRQRVDLNRADEWLLAALPGVGEARARAIAEYRSEKGSFRSPQDLLLVKGFGPAVYEKVKDLVTVGE